MNRWIQISLLFAAVFSFLLLTIPSNHSEAEDTCFYTRMAEQGVASELFHAHHLLYLPSMRALSAVAAGCGYAGSALPLLIGFSMLSGALAVCLFAALVGRKKSGILFAAALLFSYGFWRYSTAAEIYIPVTALSLLALYCARRSEDSPLFFWSCALSASGAILMHVISWPLVLVAIPFYFVATRRPQRAFLYFAAVLSIAAVVYILAVAGPGLTVFSDADSLRETWMSPRAWLKGAAAWSQNVASANFLFTIQPVAEKLQAFFPYHMLQEEVFMGRAAPGWIRFVAPGTFLVAAGAVLSVLVLSVKNIRRVAGTENWAWPVAVLLWLGGTAATALFFEPANPEMWICSLAPFWLLVSLLWQIKPRSSGWIGVMVLALVAHNMAGGMSLVESSRGDYCRQKAAWVAGQAQASDLILTAESHAFVTFLQAHTSARVVDAKFMTPESWRALANQVDGRVFVFSDVTEPLPPVTRRAPQAVEKLRQVADHLRPALKALYKDQFGTVYEWSAAR